MAVFRLWYDRLLGALVFALMVVTTVVVLLGIFYRYVLNDSLVWYDEVGEYLLVWLTYYGSAYAALRRQHIGLPNLVRAMPPAPRVAVTLAVELMVIGFFVFVAWLGIFVFRYLEYETMVSLTWINMRVPFSAVPFGGALFALAALLNLPRVVREARAGIPFGAH